jgi:uncharacterized repeat protein (TIGR03803 family)
MSALRAGRSLATTALFVLVAALSIVLQACGGGSHPPAAPPAPSLSAINVTPFDVLVTAGSTVQLTATGVKTDNSTVDLTSQATWRTSDSSVATVSSTGLVTTRSAGAVTITASDQDVTGQRTLSILARPLAEAILHRFTAQAGDVATPGAPLIQARDGNFYGTSPYGGDNVCGDSSGSCGSVFRITPAGDLTVLHAFGAAPGEGYQSTASLLQARDGNFYGTTQRGGQYDLGTVFMMTPTGTLTTLHSFGATADDGAMPMAGLIQAADGNFYGTTFLGGTNACAGSPNSCGTVFRITPAGVETVLHAFGASSSDGFNPAAALVVASDGNLCGTTVSGGDDDGGVAFRITPAGDETVLVAFGPGNGFAPSIPQGPLVPAGDGNFYGTSAQGGAGSSGTVYQLTPSGTLTVLHAFEASLTDGSDPAPYLTLGRDGLLYGSARTRGLYDGGSVFRIATDGTLDWLYWFRATDTDGVEPAQGVLQGTDGKLYGTTASSGSGSPGVFFQLTP